MQLREETPKELKLFENKHIDW